MRRGEKDPGHPRIVFLFLILQLDMGGSGEKKIGSVGSVGSFSLVENKKKDRGDGGRREGGFPGDTSSLSKQRQKSRHISFLG